uniref:Transcobalamin-like C-terminal domain-containing protein n=1 Tax=Eptatretus burgeri TaxID=7764 RepID=A0A8C4N6X5_EPTBU
MDLPAMSLLLFLCLPSALSSMEFCGPVPESVEAVHDLQKQLAQGVHDEMSLCSLEENPHTASAPHVSPSLLLAMRLASRHNKQTEKSALHMITAELARNWKKDEFCHSTTTGALGATVLAMLSSCEDPHKLQLKDSQLPSRKFNLLSSLRKKLQKERHNIECNGYPISHPFPLALGVLGLCIGGRMAPSEDHHLYLPDPLLVSHLVSYANTNAHSTDVDTLAMTYLSLTCLDLPPWKQHYTCLHQHRRQHHHLKPCDLLKCLQASCHMHRSMVCTQLGCVRSACENSKAGGDPSMNLANSSCQLPDAFRAVCNLRSDLSSRCSVHIPHPAFCTIEDTGGSGSYAQAGWGLSDARRILLQTILKAKGKNNELGNIYSTPFAIQALLADQEFTSELGNGQVDCAEAAQEVTNAWTRGELSQLGAKAQALVALEKKTYLDSASVDCLYNDNVFNLSCSDENGGPDNKGGDDSEEVNVQLIVQAFQRRNVYKTQVPVGSSLLELLHLAAKDQPQKFEFQTEDTDWGPFLVRVGDLTARPAHQEYWSLLGSDGKPLSLGIADYKFSQNENITLQFTTWLQ